jgi:hypothetical protein
MPKLSPRNPSVARSPEESARHRNFWRAVGLMFLALLICVLCVMQTGWFVVYFAASDIEEMVRSRMRDDQERQKQLRDEYLRTHPNERKDKFYIHPSFSHNYKDPNNTNMHRLERAKAGLLADEQLEAELRRKYGVSLRDVQAEVIPGWHVRGANQNLFGFTDEGWRVATKFAGDPDAKGFTVRDGRGARKVTVDGTPRIILNYVAFTVGGSDDQLRLTLLHEMLHALNVPKYTPCPLNYLQSDLLYFPEYRDFLERAGLKEDVQEREPIIWVLALLFFSGTVYQLTKAALFFASRSASTFKHP